MPKWSPNLNHLAYIDNKIIFSFANKTSLKKIMEILKDYESQSRQKVSIEKIFFYMYKYAIRNTSEMVEKCLDMNRGSFPMKYLGFPIKHTRKKKRTMMN